MLDKSLAHIFPGSPNSIGDITVMFKRDINNELIQEVNGFLSKSFDSINQVLWYKGVLVGLSGGVDSTVAASLLYQAFGDKAHAVIVDFGDSEETDFSRKLAEKIKIKHTIVRGKEVLDNHLRLLNDASLLSKIHTRSGVINTIIFQLADNEQYMVVDTADKSERLLARHAEAFMGHVAPFYDLFKSELYDIADYLELSEVKSKEAGCPELLDKDAFGVSWEVLDQILYLLSEKKVGVDEIARKYNVDRQWLAKVQKRTNNQQKRMEQQKLYLNK